MESMTVREVEIVYSIMLVCIAALVYYAGTLKGRRESAAKNNELKAKLLTTLFTSVSLKAELSRTKLSLETAHKYRLKHLHSLRRYMAKVEKLGDKLSELQRIVLCQAPHGSDCRPNTTDKCTCWKKSFFDVFNG